MAKKKKLTEIELKIKQYTPPEINYKFHRTVSYSQYSIYASCPHKWYLTYVENKAPYQSSIHTVFGTAFHETLQTYLETLYKTSRVAANKLDLEALFQERFKTTYQKEYIGTKTHFTNPVEMREFYDDGVAILNWIKKKSGGLFSIKNVRLLGIELPLIYKVSNNIYYKAFIDFALYDMDLNKLYIYDIKTSKGSWSDKQKKDKIKHDQLLLYKHYFSKIYGFDIDNIEVNFFIVKRKIWEESEYPQPRASLFSPPNGKTSVNRTLNSFENFIKSCFDDTGKPYIKQHEKIIGEDSCKWCPFADKPELCDKLN